MDIQISKLIENFQGILDKISIITKFSAGQTPKIGRTFGLHYGPNNLHMTFKSWWKNLTADQNKQIIPVGDFNV